MVKQQSSRIEADVRAILNQGLDPNVYAKSLASARGVSIDIVTAVIAAVGGSPRVVDAETVAQERLSEDRRLRHTVAYRASQHDEV